MDLIIHLLALQFKQVEMRYSDTSVSDDNLSYFRIWMICSLIARPSHEYYIYDTGPGGLKLQNDGIDQNIFVQVDHYSIILSLLLGSFALMKRNVEEE